MKNHAHRIHDALQRAGDVLIASLLLVLLSPVLLVTTFLVRKNLGSPVLFTQQRPGRNGKVFALYKFRTMKDSCDSSGRPLDDEERITPFGHKLRSTSLDEFPGLFNVLKGDMSLVGPRPLLVEYLPLYNEEQARRHEVRPGITGLAQINGRNTISWEEKFTLDVEYVDNRSCFLDMKILFVTLGAVSKRSDISPKGRSTAKPFAGTPKNMDDKPSV